MDDEPILNAREQGTIVKLALSLVALVVAGPYIAGALAVGVLLLIGTIGVIAGLANWFLWYGLPTLGVFVVFVLVLRWLFGDRRTARSRAPETFERQPQPSFDAELEVLRVRAAATEAAIVPRPARRS